MREWMLAAESSSIVCCALSMALGSALSGVSDDSSLILHPDGPSTAAKGIVNGAAMLGYV